VVACAAAAVHILTVARASRPAYAVPVRGWDYVIDENLASVVALAVVLVACLAMILAAPPSLTSSRLARRTGVAIGVAGGAQLLVSTLAWDLEAAMGQVVGWQFVAFVIAPAAVAVLARSLRAGLQTIGWGFVFGTVTMFPVYVVASISRYEAAHVLLLDDDPPAYGATVAANLGDAVWLLMAVGPGLLIPVGVFVAAVLAAIAGTLAPATTGAEDAGEAVA
jgi:hypothetical protein